MYFVSVVETAGGDVKDVDGKGMLTRITLHNGASIVFGWKLPLPVETEKELFKKAYKLV